jgi:high affinity sulfate transporter 1
MFMPKWIRSYQLSWFKNDMIAGLTLAAFLIPAGLADASMANLPPEAGLYACFAAGLFFWFFSSSTNTVVTTTSAISLLIGASLGTVAGGDISKFTALAGATALLVSAIAFIAWYIRAGVIINFISESVMVGFKIGIGLFLISTQLPKLFGFHGSHGNFMENVSTIFHHLNEIHPASLLLGVAALILLTLGNIFLKNRPISLIVLILGIGASMVFGLEALGVKVLGTLPAGIPTPSLPHAGWEQFNNLLPLAFAAFLLASVETAAVGRMFPSTDGSRFDPNKEFLALGVSNAAVGLMHGFPVSGGTSQSLVGADAKSKTLLSGLIASLVIAVVILFFTHWLSPLPQPVLAAIILMAVTSLIKPSAIIHLYRVERGEFIIALSVIVGVLVSGLLRGIFIGVIISLVLLLKRAAKPNVIQLGRIPDTDHFSDIAKHTDLQTNPDMLIFCIESGLLYFNIDYVRDTLSEMIGKQQQKPSKVLIKLSSSPYVDHNSALALAEFADTLKEKGIQLYALDANENVQEKFVKLGLDHRLGCDDPELTVVRAISKNS